MRKFPKKEIKFFIYLFCFILFYFRKCRTVSNFNNFFGFILIIHSDFIDFTDNFWKIHGISRNISRKLSKYFALWNIKRTKLDSKFQIKK